MKVERRKVLGFLALSPMAAKAVVEEGAAKLSGTRLGLSGYSGGMEPESVSPSGEIQKETWSLVRGDAKALSELKSLFFERERTIGLVDHDLASKRSFSLAAKIAYQRERNVHRSIAELGADYHWSKLEKIGKRFSNFLGFSK